MAPGNTLGGMEAGDLEELQLHGQSARSVRVLDVDTISDQPRARVSCNDIGEVLIVAVLQPREASAVAKHNAQEVLMMDSQKTAVYQDFEDAFGAVEERQAALPTAGANHPPQTGVLGGARCGASWRNCKPRWRTSGRRMWWAPCGTPCWMRAKSRVRPRTSRLALPGPLCKPPQANSSLPRPKRRRCLPVHDSDCHPAFTQAYGTEMDDSDEEHCSCEHDPEPVHGGSFGGIKIGKENAVVYRAA